MKIFIILSIIIFGIYSNTLIHPFVGFDDKRLIINNPFIKDFQNIGKLLPPQYFNLKNVPNLIRPVSIASTMIDHKIWNLNPFGFHLTNIILHLLATLLVFTLIKQLFGQEKLALITALIFALHPVHTENINVVSFRQDILAFIFFSLSIICFVKSRLSKHRANTYIILSYVSALLAFFSKDVSVVLPLIIVVYEWIFLFPNFKEKISVKITPYLPLVALSIIFLIIRSSRFEYRFPEPNDSYQITTQVSSASHLLSSLTEKLSLMANAYATYLKLLFLPIRLVADYGAVDKFNQLTLKTLISMAVSTLPLIAALFLIIIKRNKVILFGILWFYLTLLPVSNLISIVNPIAERYLYIPSFGFALIISFLFFKLEQSKKQIAYIGLTFLLLFYVTRTFLRNQDWKSDLILWEKTYSQDPTNLRVINNLAASYIDETTQVEKAVLLLEPIVKQKPPNPNPYKNLGLAYLITDENQKAIEVLDQAVKINPEQAATYRLLALAYQFENKPELEIKNLEKALELEPNFPPAQQQLIDAYRKTGENRKAKELEQKLIKLK